MSTIKNITIVGATGNIGPAVIKALLSSSSSSTSPFNISILTRDVSKVASHASLIPFLSPTTNISITTTDYSPASLALVFQNQDAVVSTIGALGMMTQIAMIDAAVAAGVKRFIPSHYAPKLKGMEEILPELYARLKPKVEVIAYLKEKVEESRKEGRDFSWSAVGCGPLFDWSLKNSFLGINPTAQAAVLTDSGNEPYNTTTSSLIGLTISKILLSPESTANKYLFIISWVTTQNQVLAACEKVSGKKWEVEYVSAQDRREEGLGMLGKGDFRGIGRLWNFWLNGDGGGRGTGKEKVDNGVLGLEVGGEDMEDVVREVMGL